jgi:alpha-galactosidase
MSAPVLRVAGADDPVALVVDGADPAGARVLFYGDWPAAAAPEGPRPAPMPRARWGARLDDPPRPTLLPGAGVGHDGAPAIEFLRPDGRWVFAPTTVDVRAEGEAVIARQTDAGSALRATTTMTLDAATGALRVATRLENLADEPVEVRWLAAAALPLPTWAVRAIDHVGDWCAEFRRETVELGEGGWLRETREGRSSHRRPPGVLLDDGRADARRGRVLGVQFAWSGDHRLRVDAHADGTRVLQAGVLLHPGEGRLGAGEALTTPDLWIACSTRGRDGIAARLHDVCRRRVLPATGQRRPRPVHLNTWEAVYFDHDPEALADLAERAAALGVERFVLDDGWFRGRTDDRRALGDWTVDPARHPDGLGPLIERVRALGMGFGLWVEPEMVNDDSDLARAHPDWLRGMPAPRAPDTGRHQRVLDLTRPEVGAHLFDVLDGLLRAHPIEYLKWDHNRVLTGVAADGSAGHLGQTRALWALLDRLRAAHPEVEIETCASGGGRADWGMLARTHRVWTSDCNDPVVRARIMAGAHPFLPPEVAGVHVGPARAHTTGRVTDLDLRAAVSLLGASGLELDVRDLDAADTERLAAHVGRYRRWREVLHGGRLSTPVDDGEHLVRIAVAPDGGRALAIVLRLDDREPGRPVRFALADLDPGRRYRVRLEDPPPDPTTRPPALSAPGPWRAPGTVVDGAWLAGPGLTLQLPAPQRAVVLALEAE